MRTIASVLGALALIACTVAPAAAQTQSKSQRGYVKKAPPKYPTGRQYTSQPRDDSGYREQLADKLPFGSSAWWEQMQRENRLGGETP